MPNQEPIIYIIDDDEALCKALCWMLESVNLKTIAYHSALEFLGAYQVSWRGCLLIDIRMPDMSGLQLQEKLIEVGNLIPIIMMTGHGDISMAVRAMKAGAFDFITKPFNDQIMLEQIQKALSLNKQIETKQSAHMRYQLLTHREKQIFAGVGSGKMNKQIAYELGISHKTVELHRSNVMQKMEVKTMAELVKLYYAIMEKALT